MRLDLPGFVAEVRDPIHNHLGKITNSVVNIAEQLRARFGSESEEIRKEPKGMVNFGIL